jgi:hypothetical protein
MSTALTQFNHDERVDDDLDMSDLKPENAALESHELLSDDELMLRDALATEAPETPCVWSELALQPLMVQAVIDLGYTVPTPIQDAVIPVMLKGRDVIGQAQTGTG